MYGSSLSPDGWLDRRYSPSDLTPFGWSGSSESLAAQELGRKA
jgi:hypothetical protein